MNHGNSSQTVVSAEANSVKNRYVVEASQVHALSHLPSTSGPEVSSWNLHSSNTIGTGSFPSSSYLQAQQTETLTAVQDGTSAISHANSSSFGMTNPQPNYSYGSYSSSTDPYSYGSTGYPGYYNGYQQQPNNSYSQPVGVYQNTGAPYQPLSSFQNTGSYAGPASYSSTYYNPADYQTCGGYSSSSYTHQAATWNDGNYANYTTSQYPNYTADTSSVYSSSNAAATSFQYQQHYKQWADYYNQTEVSCAPGTENLSVSHTSNQACQIPCVSSGYATSSIQAPQSYIPPWRPEPSVSQTPPLQPAAAVSGAYDSYWKHGTPSVQDQHPSSMQLQPHLQKPLELKASYSVDNSQEQHKNTVTQFATVQNPATSLPSQSYLSPLQTVPSSDTRRISKMQIQTNPRIASNLPFGLEKTEKDDSNNSTVAKPAYISVSLPTCSEKVLSSDAADSVLKPGTFPPSLRGYVERALGRCKDDTQIATSQAVLKEVITKASADGSLQTKNWDIEPLFPLPNAEMMDKDLQGSMSGTLPRYKRSPTKRPKSRWEPLLEEKKIDQAIATNNGTAKYGSWLHTNDKDNKPVSVNSEGRINSFGNTRFNLVQQKSATKMVEKPMKRRRLADWGASDNGDASSDSDKEQSSTPYYSSAMALADSPEEQMRRESRSKRFEKVHGNKPEISRFKPKSSGTGDLYTRRASALVLSKDFNDGGSRAVEDIDWDALTVKGTCQEIEKRYLRLTSAPDPSTVRPEEVLEKALQMVQTSQKNYLYKCDQLKSIRQDLTVQRIRNQLTVKVYETHARLAIEVGDLPEYNQCQSQLKILYAEGIEGCHMEFSAYNLLCVILHSNNHRDLLSSMSRLSDEAKKDRAVQHALAVRAAVTSGNYVMFFKLYKTAPNLNTCLMDLYVEKMRYKAVNCMSRSYRPTIPVSYIAEVLGFSSSTGTLDEGTDEKDSDGVEECTEWLKAHGACVVADNSGEMQLDAKASSSSLFMPDPEDAVSHGDANLAVNDFLTRTPSVLNCK